MDETKMSHKRSLYTFLDILGHIGGLEHAFTGVLGIIFLLCSENSMMMEQANFLFLLNNKDAKMLDAKNVDKVNCEAASK